MTSHSITAKPAKSRFDFVTGILGELKKVVWLTRQEVIYLTVLVLVVTLISGLVLGLFDYGFSALVDKVLIAK
jgi:preprotein translocase subunit SecE